MAETETPRTIAVQVYCGDILVGMVAVNTDAQLPEPDEDDNDADLAAAAVAARSLTFAVGDRKFTEQEIEEFWA